MGTTEAQEFSVTVCRTSTPTMILAAGWSRPIAQMISSELVTTSRANMAQNHSETSGVCPVEVEACLQWGSNRPVG
jgi:hypothetical protein